MGKGSTPRPYAVDQDTFAARWEATFGAKPEGSPQEDSTDGQAADLPDAE